MFLYSLNFKLEQKVHIYTLYICLIRNLLFHFKQAQH